MPTTKTIKENRDKFIAAFTQALDACIKEEEDNITKNPNKQYNLSTFGSELVFQYNNGSLYVKSKVNIDLQNDKNGGNS